MNKSLIVFDTPRLIIRDLQAIDQLNFFDLMGNPKVMHPIPLSIMTRAESDEHLEALVEEVKMNPDKKVWGIDTKVGDSFIGLCALIKNDEGEDELAYRLREKFWKIGFGTELTKGLINHVFNELDLDLITADVNIENKNSVKILDKYFSRMREFENKVDNCIDRRYKLTKSEWFNQSR